MNVLLVSHGDFTTNSALHVYAIASELHARSFRPTVAVPANAETVSGLGRPAFPVLTFQDARRNGLPSAPELIHVFTAREHVRRFAADLVRAHRCPYVVHLEDNDDVIRDAVKSSARIRLLPSFVVDHVVGTHQLHPVHGPDFVARADGVTVVHDRLLELAPPNIPKAVVRPGFDPTVLAPEATRAEIRRDLRMQPGDFLLVYPGNVHAANLDDMRDLYGAVRLLRRDGVPVVLAKSGRDTRAARALPALGDAIRDLGWVSRSYVASVVAAADALVQPGAPGPFNDYRFPSKVPDFLASGRPVVLTRTNVGLSLRDGQEAIVLERGTSEEIANAIRGLRDDAELAAKIGAAGRAFALRELRWSSSVDHAEALYRRVVRGRKRGYSSPRP